jgi:hypothetical protein
MNYIELTRNKKAIVDNKDYELLNQWKWKLLANGAAARNVWLKDEKKYVMIYMHRLIMDAPIGKVVDHINGNRIDNRRSNLRVCEHRQNIQNQKLRIDSKSGIKGVYLHNQNKTWCARFRRKHLGVFKTPELAAQAYNREALKAYGEFARLNP